MCDIDKEKLKAPDWALKLIDFLGDRLWDGFIVVDATYTIRVINPLLRRDFQKKPGRRNSKGDKHLYFELFFGLKNFPRGEEVHDEPPVIQVIEKEVERAQEKVLAVNGIVYDVVSYPLKVEEGKLWAVEVWRHLGPEELFRGHRVLTKQRGKLCLLTLPS